MTPEILVLGLTWFVVFLFSTTLHEAGHAWAAYKLGDPTAYEGGQVSLNPLPHIQREPIGMVVVPIILLMVSKGQWMMGWASAPYDPIWAHRYPRRAALMALAGPAGNLLLVLVSGIILRIGMNTGIWVPLPFDGRLVQATAEGSLADAASGPLSIVFILNLALFVFNLLPLPPLDGSAVLPAFLSNEAAARYNAFLHQPMISLLALFLAWRIFPFIFLPVLNFAQAILYA